MLDNSENRTYSSRPERSDKSTQAGLFIVVQLLSYTNMLHLRYPPLLKCLQLDRLADVQPQSNTLAVL